LRELFQYAYLSAFASPSLPLYDPTSANVDKVWVKRVIGQKRVEMLLPNYCEDVRRWLSGCGMHSLAGVLPSFFTGSQYSTILDMEGRKKSQVVSDIFEPHPAV